MLRDQIPVYYNAEIGNHTNNPIGLVLLTFFWLFKNLYHRLDKSFDPFFVSKKTKSLSKKKLTITRLSFSFLKNSPTSLIIFNPIFVSDRKVAALSKLLNAHDFAQIKLHKRVRSMCRPVFYRTAKAFVFTIFFSSIKPRRCQPFLRVRFIKFILINKGSHHFNGIRFVTNAGNTFYGLG